MYTEAYYQEKIKRMEAALKAAAKEKAEMYEVLTTNIYSTTLTAQDFYDRFVRDFEIDSVPEEIEPTYHINEMVAAPVSYLDDTTQILQVSDFLISAKILVISDETVMVSFSEKAQEKAQELLGEHAHLLNPDGLLIPLANIRPLNIGSTIYLVDVE